jgi:hypothetical protein
MTTEEQIKAAIEAASRNFVYTVEASGQKLSPVAWEEVLKALSVYVEGMVYLQQQNAALRAKIVALGGNPELP